MGTRIGITTLETHGEAGLTHSLSDAYVLSIRDAGGLPVLLPSFPPGTDVEKGAAACLEFLDGLVLSGGGDFSAHLFGEEPHPAVRRVSDRRDSFEFALLRAARSLGLPVLGICRGCQAIALAAGGSIWQDIPSQVPGAHGHSPAGLAMDQLYHGIEIPDSSSRLGRALGSVRLRVNSFHHQSVRDPGKGMIVSARSPDGIVEAIEAEDPEWFCLGVQFHPETLTAGHPEFRGLFRALTAAAARRG